jgi:hypothetical protein
MNCHYQHLFAKYVLRVIKTTPHIQKNAEFSPLTIWQRSLGSDCRASTVNASEDHPADARFLPNSFLFQFRLRAA